MWLVLCDSTDLPALWAAQGLQRRGLKPLEILTPDLLLYNRSFIYHLGDFQANSVLELMDGRTIYSNTLCGTLNRIRALPFKHWQTVKAADRNYAESELYALWTSWLYSLPGPMVNRPTPQGLSGRQFSTLEWLTMAIKAGLTTLPYTQNDTQGINYPALTNAAPLKIVVCNQRCFSSGFMPIPAAINESCVKLAALTQMALVELDFYISPQGQWIFLGANTLPDLRLGGESLLDALAQDLQK